MAGLDLFTLQELVKDYLVDKINWPVDTGATPEAENLQLIDGVLSPYVVLRFSDGMPAQSERGNSFGGALYDEYYTYVDALCVAAKDVEARALASIVNRTLLGKVFENASEVKKAFGGGTFAVPDAQRKPVAFVAIVSFRMNYNQTGVGTGSLMTP